MGREIRNLTRERWDQTEFSLEGYSAYCKGLTKEDVPRHLNELETKYWLDGWHEGHSETDVQ